MLQFLRRRLARWRIARSLETHFSEAEIDEIVSAAADPQLGAVETEITPIFANVHNYVGIAEQVPLRRLPALMNAWFEAATSAIGAEGGTLDKFVGDVVVGMFGAPLPLPDHALRGCVAALRCQAGVAALREQLRHDAEPWPELAQQLRVRIGLHTGVATIGNLGTASRFNYTMMGDNVNLAARLESAAKLWGVPILCSGQTRAACERTEAGRVLFRRLGRAIVKGRTEHLEINEPTALREDGTPRLRECTEVFEAGLRRYEAGDWPGALRHFETSARLEPKRTGLDGAPDANPSTRYIDLCHQRQAGARQ